MGLLKPRFQQTGTKEYLLFFRRVLKLAVSISLLLLLLLLQATDGSKISRIL
jgi:hypothetical protein